MVRPAMSNQNVRLAKQRWTGMPKIALIALRELTRQYRLSVALGDLLYIHVVRKPRGPLKNCSTAEVFRDKGSVRSRTV